MATDDGAAPSDVGGPRMTVEGRLQVQGITMYQYGSHVLIDERGETAFAVRSSVPGLLEGAVGRRVRIAGQFVVGYPVDLGPPLLNVDEVAAL